MSWPLVTIGMPVYNGERHVARALRSVLGQTYPNLEIVVVDNCSTDATPEIISKVTAGDERVALHNTARTTSVMENFGRCLALARGTYFMWAASDDEWAPTFVADLVGELEGHPECAVAMSAVDHRLDHEPQTFDIVRFAGGRDPTRRSHLFVALGQATGRVPYFQYIYGLYRTDFLRSAFKRYPRVVGSDGLFTIQVALGTRLRYIDRVLTTRGLTGKSWTEKYPDDDLAPRMAHPLADVITLFVAVPYLGRSAVIPLRRKLLLPVVFAALAVRHLTLAAGTLRARTRLRRASRLTEGSGREAGPWDGTPAE